MTMQPLELPELSVLRLRARFAALEDIRTQAWKGAPLHGALKFALRRLACEVNRGSECLKERCEKAHVCAYVHLMETLRPTDAEVLRLQRTVPRPLVLQPPETPTEGWDKGEVFEFDLLVFGTAWDNVPWLLKALSEMEVGRAEGFSRGLVQLLEVIDRDTGETVFIPNEYVREPSRRENLRVLTKDRRERLCSMSNDKDVQIQVHFLSPARIQNRGDVILNGPVPFQALVRAAVNRVSSLNWFHGNGKELPWDFRAIKDLACSCRHTGGQVAVAQRSRHSSTSHRALYKDGLLGWLGYKGPVGPLVPALLAGEILHVGKDTALGHGRIMVVCP